MHCLFATQLATIEQHPLDLLTASKVQLVPYLLAMQDPIKKQRKQKQKQKKKKKTKSKSKKKQQQLHRHFTRLPHLPQKTNKQKTNKQTNKQTNKTKTKQNKTKTKKLKQQILKEDPIMEYFCSLINYNLNFRRD